MAMNKGHDLLATWKELVGFFTKAVNSCVAEDLASVTIEKLIAHPWNPDGGASYSTWVYRIADGVKTDYLRRYYREPTWVDINKVENELSDKADIYNDETRVLLDAIAELPPRNSAIAVLYYFEDLTMGEVGRVIGISTGRVSQIINGEILPALAENPSVQELLG